MSQVDNLLPDHIKSTLSDAEVDSDGEINMDKVPFARNTIRMDMKKIDRNLKAMHAQNKENLIQDKSDENQNRACTPVNEVEVPGQPLTPTANLKVLFNAMSPELRYRDEQKREVSDEDISPSSSQDYQFETVIDMADEMNETNNYNYSRKKKSLGLLCQKFLQKYPEYPKPGEKYEICLDAVAKELQVERRRIYDIVNVLESVEIVSRLAKNKYAWHGKSNLSTTLAKLKALGDSEGFGEQIQKLKNYEFYRELEEQMGPSADMSQVSEPDFSVFGENSLFNQAALRKDKSLGIMSQKFLMLFLVSKPKTVNLDMSAKLLIGDANIDKTENAKFKTKIRRLYDIANILTSLDLIRKVHVTEIRGRKPAFKYVGPDIDACEELQTMACCTDGCHRPISRHSMLDCIQNQSVARIMNNYKGCSKHSKPFGRVLSAASDSGEGSKDDSSLKFGRHSSFEQLCAVAAVETDRMKASSEPASPVKLETESDLNPQMSVWNKKAITVIAKEGPVSQVVAANEKPQSKVMNSLPTKGFVRKKSVNNTGKAVKPVTASPAAGSMKAETIIIKAMMNQSRDKDHSLPLTQEQVDMVLRSLKIPVPVSSGTVEKPTKVAFQSVTSADSNTVDSVCCQKVVEMKEINEKTPVVTISTPERRGNKRLVSSSDVIPIEKRIKLDFPSPPSSGEDRSPMFDQDSAAIARFKRKICDVKPSPQRALHLAPEFANASVTLDMSARGDASSSDILQVVSADGSKPQRKKVEIIINESSPSGTPTTMVRSFTLSNPMSTKSQVLSAPLPAQQAAVLTVPMANVPGQQKVRTIQVPISHSVQLVQSSNGSGVPHLVQVPCTFSPPLTPKSSASSGSSVFSYSYPGTKPNTINLTTMQLNQSSLSNGSSVANLIRPIATKAVLSPSSGSQIVPPQVISSSTISPITYLNKTPSGFVPIVSSSSSMTKISVVSNSNGNATVESGSKLADISALS